MNRQFYFQKKDKEEVLTFFNECNIRSNEHRSHIEQLYKADKVDALHDFQKLKFSEFPKILSYRESLEVLELFDDILLMIIGGG